MSELADGTPRFEQAGPVLEQAGPALEQVPEQANILVTDPAPDPQPAQLAAQVKGRIDIEDEVVEKVAGLAATEVEGVADLGGDVARTVESVRERIGIGHRRGDQGVKAHISGREVSIEVTIVIEYGHVVMEVARHVKTNVAIQTNRMLGLRVVEVNVIVDDVRMPAVPKAAEPVEDERLTIGS